MYYDVGIEGNTTPIDGVNIWSFKWQRTGEKSFKVPHPQYSNQRHFLRCYQVETEGKVIEFAAGELSNMVWCIYIKPR